MATSQLRSAKVPSTIASQDLHADTISGTLHSCRCSCRVLLWGSLSHHVISQPRLGSGEPDPINTLLLSGGSLIASAYKHM